MKLSIVILLLVLGLPFHSILANTPTDVASNSGIVPDERHVDYENTLDQWFLAFNGSGYHEQVIDFNQSAIEKLGHNWTDYGIEYRFLCGFEFNLVNQSVQFERGDFVFVLLLNESLEITPNASYYMDNDSFINVVPRPILDEEHPKEVFPVIFGFEVDIFDLLESNNTSDNPYIAKFAVFYTGNEFMNISLVTNLHFAGRVIYEVGVSDNNSVGLGLAWLLFLMGHPIYRRRKSSA